MTSFPERDVSVWAEEGRRVVSAVAGMLGLPKEVYARDPQQLISRLQGYVSELPLHAFERSDWVTLHTDLLFYVADFLVHKHGAQWVVVDDPRAPRGYRYVVQATGKDGQMRAVDPADVVMSEFSNQRIDITRMLASAELTLRLSVAPDC